MDDKRIWCKLNKGVKMLPKEQEKEQSQKKGNIIKNLILKFDLLKFLAIIFCMLLFILIHEESHAVVYKEYNCVNTTYGIDFKGVHINADCSSLTVERQNDVDLIQGIAEIIQYPMIFFLGLFLVLLLPEKKS
jgi:hypothetical protein